jgi:hypothetical protein
LDDAPVLEDLIGVAAVLERLFREPLRLDRVLVDGPTFARFVGAGLGRGFAFPRARLLRRPFLKRRAHVRLLREVRLQSLYLLYNASQVYGSEHNSDPE